MRVLSPTTLQDACAMLSDSGGQAIPMAGCTDLLVHWPGNLPAHDRTYLDLTRLSDLRPIRWTDAHLELGALTTYWDLITDPRAPTEFPILIAAARTVGAIQIQARGTWAGNIINASPAADGVPALMACDATVVLASRSNGSLDREEVPLDDFYQGYKQMRRRPDQLIESIRIPRRRGGYRLWAFEKVGARRAQAITKVGAAVTHSASGWRIVANSVAPTVRRCRSVEKLLESQAPIKTPEDLATALAQDISPIDDIRSTAHYRQRVLARVLFAIINEPRTK